MAEQNKIIGSDMKKLSITRAKTCGIRWTVENISKMQTDTEVFSPDFYLTLAKRCCISFRIGGRDLYVYILNKSAAKIEIERTLVLYDCNNKKLHEEKDNIFSVETDEFKDLIGSVADRRSFNTLTNDTLIIDLCVSIKETIFDTDPERKLMEDLKTMQENPINSDVSLQVGDECIPAHWAILCSRSPYFKRMFNSGMQESVKNSVTITDSPLVTVKKLIQFFYTAEFIQTGDIQELFDLYYAADKYEVMDLRTLCGRKIVSNTTADNVCEIFNFSRRHNDKGMKKGAIDFIRSHSGAIFQTEGWKKFEVSEAETAELIKLFCSEKN